MKNKPSNTRWFDKVKLRIKNWSAHTPKGFKENWQKRGKIKRFISVILPVKAVSEKVGTIKEKSVFFGGMMSDLFKSIADFSKFAIDTILILFKIKEPDGRKDIELNLDNIEIKKYNFNIKFLNFIKYYLLTTFVAIWFFHVLYHWKEFNQLKIFSLWSIIVFVLSIIVSIISSEIKNRNNNLVLVRMKRNVIIFFTICFVLFLSIVINQLNYLKINNHIQWFSSNIILLIGFSIYTYNYYSSYKKFKGRKS